MEPRRPEPRTGAISARSRWLAWLWVALSISSIQSLGSNQFSVHQTSRFLGPMLVWLLPDASPETLDVAQFAIRKTAHVVEYGILALLSLRAWRLSFGWTHRVTALASMAIVLAVAAIDESQQTWASDRAGAASDVLLDTIGGACALMAGRFATQGLLRWRLRRASA